MCASSHLLLGGRGRAKGCEQFVFVWVLLVLRVIYFGAFALNWCWYLL